MAGDLSFRIELDSADAEQAFQRLEVASRGLLGSLEKMASAISGGGLAAFATTVGIAATAAAGLTAGLFGMAKAASSTVDELGEMAAQMGSTVEEMSTLQSALGQFEANTETLQRAFNRMGNTIQEVMPAIQKSVRDATATMEKDMLAVAEAEVKLRELRTGIKAPAWVQEEINLKKQLLVVDEALGKADENAANSVQRLVRYVDALSKGFSTAGMQVNATVDNVIKGVVASVAGGVKGLSELGEGFVDIAKQTPAVRDVLFKLADVFKNTENSALKMSIATKLFGRKDAKDMVEALSVGSAAIKEQEARYKALGLVITDADATISTKFIAGMNRLGSVIGIISTQFGLLFQPVFTELLNSMAGALEKNRASIIAWGKAIADTVGPVLESLGRALAGTAQAGKDDWAVRMIDGIKALGTAATAVIGGVVMPLLRGLLQMAEGVAFGINQVFGTAFSGLEIIVIAVLGRMALAFSAMLLGAGPVGLAILGIGLALGLLITYWPQISAAAKTAWDAITTKAAEAKAFIDAWVTTPIANAWQWITDAWTGIGTWISTKLDEATALITAWVTTPISNAWQWVVDKWNAAKEAMFGKSGGAAAAPQGAAAGGQVGFAGGGLLGGRGTGTSDSNLAWVSRGEYITPARAVAQPGVLAFLEALRRSGGSLRDVLDGMGRFALGGMVRGPIGIPAFAGGGMNAVTINFPGLPEITGLRASSAVVDELRKAAAMAQVRSGGRKPSRYS